MPTFSLTLFPPHEPHPRVREGSSLKLYTSPMAPWELGMLMSTLPVESLRLYFFILSRFSGRV